MVKKRVLNPIPVLDEALLSEALRGEGIKEVCGAGVVYYSSSSASNQVTYGRCARADASTYHRYTA